MTIENLIKEVPPPAKPDEPFSGPWEPIEAELGTPLPQDYKDFVRLYGSGSFMELLAVNVPGCQSPYVRFEAELHAVHSVVLPDDVMLRPLWPSPEGLIVFGKTDFGDYLFWLAQGAPEDWRVVVWGRGLGTFEIIDRDLTDFLAGLATGEIEPQEFPEDMLPCEHLFRPFSDWPDRDEPATD